jgi:hypothetical protein
VLSQKDLWVGKAITDARLAYECWIALLRGEIKIEPESTPNMLGGGYANLFTNYAKGAFLGAVAVLHRGFFKMEKGVLAKKKAAYRMLEVVSEEQMDELLKLTAPLHSFRDKDQHRENPDHPPVWSVQVKPSRPIIGTRDHGYIDPFPIYELLKSMEPAIGYVVFHQNRKASVQPPADGTGLNT